jgi:hypothetical protein
MTAATTARPTRRALGRFLRLITPLRVPLLFAVILAAWPLVLPLAWLALLTYCGVWLIRDKLRSPVTTKATTPAAPAAAARPGRKTSVLQPSVVAAIRDNGSRVAIQETSANRIRPTGGQLRKR